jgi:hypothetical protein
MHETYRAGDEDSNFDQEEVSDPNLLFDREWEVDSDSNVHPRSSSRVYDWMTEDELKAEILANEEEADPRECLLYEEDDSCELGEVITHEIMDTEIVDE